MDLSNYLEMFIEESKDHLQAINDELLKLETDPNNTAIINEIFRSAHTLKGMAGSMGFDDLASLTHQMENVLDLLRNSKLVITTEIMDVIFKCVDFIEKMVDSVEQGGDGKENVVDIVQQLEQIQNPSSAHHADVLDASLEVAVAAELVIDEYQYSVINEARKTGNQVFQITVTLDERCVMKSIRAYMVFQIAEELGEIIQTHPTVEQIEEDNFGDSFSLLLLSQREIKEIQTQLANVSEVKEVIVSEQIHQEMVLGKEVDTQTQITQAQDKEDSADSKKKQRSKSIRVDIDKLDHLMNLFSELIIDRGRLEQIARKSELSELTETVEHMTRISTDLQDLVLNMRMVPVEQVFNRFPRLVRDLAKELNKKVQLVMEGAETELDRTVIDEIGDPLVHLLRNALDHGLESAEERKASNKNEEGTILLKAYHGGNHVFIEVIDDGKGINREKVLSKAIERGVISSEEAKSLSDQQIYALIFSSGFSTADKISDISGRGVGLDVVKTKIESLGGVITIDSTPGQGSIFHIQLPLTLSIINSMLVRVEDETYAIPFSSIVEITMVSQDIVSTLHGQRVIQFRGQVVPLVYLNEVFHVPSSETEFNEQQHYVIIVRKGTKTVGLVVDSVLGQQEVVLKSLGGFLDNLYAISGATILGNGEVALIIDSNQFIK
ncbi:chemotaxis protein CheA [Neobacillus vireti]|uniref:Chemotaxis protein CheA n=1 Tax=Neobacillus vireti LMG 21834 TaxID=1131730 RepID=A0AB94IM34_9BACI|nr:chemotaxis protein CheA [Neobacillus vireti]ETI68114.1 chemotaxis protein CheA [Neobacillus vireti LMG 21834]KLT19795.1 chemotaxis protein CheA [Neobacillus vireti]